ncbi:TPA: hypothetical protein ACRMZW_004311 [Pseudomonas aeruginosa]
MRAPAIFIAALIAAQAAVAEPMGECHQYRDGPVGVIYEVHERLQIAELKADLHAAQMAAVGGEPRFAASRRALPSEDQLRAAFDADRSAWRYSCRSPHVVALDRSLSRISSAAAQARKADLQK